MTTDPLADYYRPLVQNGTVRPAGAVPLAGGWGWFDHAERLNRHSAPKVVPAAQIPARVLARLTASRPPVAGLDMAEPRLMGILNVTPDSFSDGGLFTDPKAARAQALAMISAGADILDIGGESTRPGADEVSVDQEILRTEPVIAAVREVSDVPLSIDTRKAAVAQAAVQAGATMINDVSALNFDPQLADVAAESDVSLCLMHAQGTPKTMQAAPAYENVLLDVYDALYASVERAVAAGISRDRIVVDPGIGFGKTLDHNLALLRGLSLFHGLGCPVLLGASRKGFIGALASVSEARDRMPGSVAVALDAIAQGVQIVRVHDMGETRQALTLWAAVREMKQV